MVKNLSANERDERDAGVPGSGRCPWEGNANPLRYSCLENSMDRRAWQATVNGVTKSQTRLSRHTHNHIYFMPLHFTNDPFHSLFLTDDKNSCPLMRNFDFYILKKVLVIYLLYKPALTSLSSFKHKTGSVFYKCFMKCLQSILSKEHINIVTIVPIPIRNRWLNIGGSMSKYMQSLYIIHQKKKISFPTKRHSTHQGTQWVNSVRVPGL